MKLSRIIKKATALFIAIVIMSQPVLAAETYKSRAEIPEKYKWKLTDIYKTQADWEKDIKLIEEKFIPLLASYKGKLDSKENVLACFKEDTEAAKLLDKIYGYAILSLELDGGSTNAQKITGRAGMVRQKYTEATSYIFPELLSKDETVIKGYMADPDFKNNFWYFDTLLKSKPHILPESETELLAGLSVFTQSPEDIYSMLTNVDISFPSVKDSKGNEVEVSEGNLGTLFESPDRDLRKAVSNSLRNTYKSFNNTLAATLSAEVSKNVFYARAENYNSALEASLSPDIPVSVYKNLISSANKGLAPLHKYISLKKEALGVEKVHGYDMFAPIIPEQTKYYSFDEAEKLVKDALKPLGKEYAAVLDMSFSQNWIDVYETPNKRTGAFSYYQYGIHPFVLLNYDGSLYEVSTIAHELGHAVHQYYSGAAQPYDYSGVSVFTTEAASTANQILLCKYLIGNAETNSEKLFYINDLISWYNRTFYNQTFYAEFEKTIHETVEAGETLTAETLNGIWEGLLNKYYGKDYETDEQDAVGWSRIPHFYYNFYVYQYATSIAAANKLSSGILDGKPGALDKYLEFLNSGSQYDPIKTFENVGIDMNSPQVFEEFVKEFEALVNEMERLMKLEGIIE